MIRRIIVLLAVATVTLGGAARAVAAQPDLNEQDKKFLVQLHRVDLTAIQAGNLAQRRSTDRSITDLGKILVDDHTKLDESVRQVAQKAGVPLPEDPNANQRQQLAELSRLTGQVFDNVWLAAMITGHRQTLDRLDQELSEGSSPEVKKLAEDARPVVREHLNMLRKARGGPMSPSPSPSPSGTMSPSPTGTMSPGQEGTMSPGQEGTTSPAPSPGGTG
ncbi:putative membrane protein [Streptosporangium canum]|uniref:Putative membrane protein n=1 Tax=Streptosporangium canum TaxID=324952 RepID=A0A1I3WVH7_9ACTN|nr:DUF4142 domain-containing protein [Streptosporangium canum]SFK10411.1 putative membrane protein [Streptosporangium canum]